MFRLRTIRKKPPLAVHALRGAEVAFWLMLALAVGVGGYGALDGLPGLGGLVSPGNPFAAEARGKPQFSTLVLLGPTPGTKAPLLFPRDTQEGTAPRAGRLAAIAIVIDDMGNDAANDRRAIALPRAVALSFLPYPDGTQVLAREGARAGHDILAHVPMQAEGAGVDPGPMALRLDLPGEENTRRLEWALSRVPGYVGINNHEGSAFTQDRRALLPVAEALADRRVFFFDSRTTPNSQVVPVARAFGVPSAARDVFLDDVQTAQAVEGQLARLEALARRGGVAIAIGHPHAVTLDVLTRWCASLKGYRLIPLAGAIGMKTQKEMSLAALGR